MDTMLVLVFTALTALATLLIAVFTWKSAKATRDAAISSTVSTLMGYMGSFPDVGAIRGRLRKELSIKDTSGNLTGIKEVQTVPNPDQTISDVITVSASFDRACAAMVMAMSKEQVLQAIDLFGDALLNYWAFCFKVLRKYQKDNDDDDNRMFFEYITYVSFGVFTSHGRKFQTQHLYESLGAKAHMDSRLPILKKKDSLRKFATKMR